MLHLWAATLTAAFEISPGVFLPGANTRQGQEGTTELLGVSQKITAPGGTTAGGGGAAIGHAVFGDLVLFKNLDRTPPLLMLGAATGLHLPTVTIRFYIDQAQLTNYYAIVLTNVIVTSVETTGTPSGTRNEARETVSLSFARISLRDELQGIATCWGVAQSRTC